ncbi:hypothetical protein Tco_1246640, partial [Tanacetum coccineum]
MTGNKAYLAEFQDFNGGPIAFRVSKGYITVLSMKKHVNHRWCISRDLMGFRESLRRVFDGTEALLLPTLFILWLATVSTYLKHVGNFKHSDLKTKKFEEIQ